MRLRQVLLNLVGNALKFTHQGEVVVNVSLANRTPAEATSEDIQQARAMLHFRVIDTGIGIPADKLALIFEAFEQADTSTTREYGGTGLGLAISRRLAGMMNGLLWVDSEVGRGSTFHFTADVGVSPASSPWGDRCEMSDGTRVLVVGGHRTNRDILVEILESWTMDVRTARSAGEAMSELAAAEALRVPFDVVIVDAQLPEGSGFNLAEVIRNHATLGGTPVVTLINADRAGAAEAERAGVAACLMKPVKQSELFNALLAALGHERGQACQGPLAVDGPADLPPLSILVGEDSQVNQKLIYEILTRRGHTVALAANGEEVLARLAQDRFDIVLMDVQMPLMDGFETTRRIRRQQQNQGRHIPVVAMTAHALPDDRNRCLAAGMDDYVAKPIRVPVLMATIAAVIGRCGAVLPSPVLGRGRAPCTHGRGEGIKRAAVPLPAAGEQSAEEDLPVGDSAVDWNQTLRELDGSTQVLQILIEAAMDEVPRLMAAIRQALAARDAGKLRLSAHTLKGAMRYFGETRAYREAFSLETLACEANFAAAAETLQRLDVAVGQILRCLADYVQREAMESAPDLKSIRRTEFIPLP